MAMAGTPLALALDIPVGAWLGALGGWQLAFYASTALVMLNMLWVMVTLPNLSGQSVDDHELSRVLVIPGLRTILFALTAYMVAHNIIYTYITDFLRYARMGSQTGWVLFAFGSSPSLFIGGAIKATGQAAHVAQSITITVFSASITLGGFIGGKKHAFPEEGPTTKDDSWSPVD
jgi:predicted MFS family arabinose efflux permease